MSTIDGGWRGPNIVKDGLVLYLDAGSPNSYYGGRGTVWKDMSGNGNNGTLTNGPTFNSGNGGSIVFDGVDDYVDLGVIPNLQFSNIQAFSVSIWVYWTPIGATLTTLFSYGHVAGSNPDSGDEGYYITLDNGVLRSRSFLFDYYDGSAARSIQGNVNVVPTNSWINLVCISGGNNDTSNDVTYIDGALISTTSRRNQSPSTINYSVSAVNVAARDSKATINSRVSSVSVYNRALSATEVLQNFNATRARFGI